MGFPSGCHPRYDAGVETTAGSDHLLARMEEDLRRIGIGPGSLIMVHSSLKSLGPYAVDPELVVCAMMGALSPGGTLLMPALSLDQEPDRLHSTADTPSDIGAIPEHFRLRAGTLRSVHPTHSVCGAGPRAAELLERHAEDSTPCGPGSPFRRILDLDARIVMLGCGLLPNTTMHAIEELVEPPYLFGEPCEYHIAPAAGCVYTKRYRRHAFHGWTQRYDRIADLGSTTLIATGQVLDAEVHVIDTRLLKTLATAALRRDPWFFVEPDRGAP